MDAENISIDNCSQREEIKGLVKVLPAVGVSIFFIDLIKETVHHRHISALVIASEQVDSIRILDFHTEKHCNGFN